MPSPFRHITFTPWVGENFATANKTRLLILGESHYGLPGEYDSELTICLTRQYIRGDWDHRFWTNIMQVVTGKSYGEIDRSTFWHSIAFYNFVQVFAGEKSRMPPTYQMFKDASGAFFEALDHVKPTHVLALGVRLWSGMPEFDGPFGKFPVDGKERAWGTYRYDGGAALAAHIWHPSSGFSASRWHKVVKSFLNLPPCEC